MGVAMLKYRVPVCRFLNLSVNQEVIGAKSFQNAFCKWSEMLNLHVSEKCFFEKNLHLQV